MIVAKIAVIGSINMDLVIETDVIPKKGETVFGKRFFTSPGGKGANQAVAAANLGGEVMMFGSIGVDQYGKALQENLVEKGIETKYLNINNEMTTGVAIIQICEQDNRIIVSPGANQLTNINYLTNISNMLESVDVILMQLEVPFDGIEFMIKLFKACNKTIILDPAPAISLPEEIINDITFLTPNELECSVVLNTTDSTAESVKKYPNKLLVTCGKNGVLYHDGNKLVTIPSFPVDVVDTTGAGDTFAGAFAVAISEGWSLHHAIQFANASASLSTTKMGAQKGMPSREEVMKVMKDRFSC